MSLHKNFKIVRTTSLTPKARVLLKLNLEIHLIVLISISIRFLYFISSHPVALVGLILVQALVACGVAWVTLKTSWFSYILFLIFLGGLIVLFIYITRLASNEIIKIKPLALPSLLSSTLIIAWLFSHNREPNINPLILNLDYLISLYSAHILVLTSGAILYLFLTLVVVVKITSKFDAPVKNFIY